MKFKYSDFLSVTKSMSVMGLDAMINNIKINCIAITGILFLFSTNAYSACTLNPYFDSFGGRIVNLPSREFTIQHDDLSIRTLARFSVHG